MESPRASGLLLSCVCTTVGRARSAQRLNIVAPYCELVGKLACVPARANILDPRLALPSFTSLHFTSHRPYSGQRTPAALSERETAFCSLDLETLKRSNGLPALHGRSRLPSPSHSPGPSRSSRAASSVLVQLRSFHHGISARNIQRCEDHRRQGRHVVRHAPGWLAGHRPHRLGRRADCNAAPGRQACGARGERRDRRRRDAPA